VTNGAIVVKQAATWVRVAGFLDSVLRSEF
jgi:hypothetical protein